MVSQTGESQECRQLSLADIEIKVNFILKNIERQTHNTDALVNIEQVVMKVILDYVPTPPRDKRVLVD